VLILKVLVAFIKVWETL